MDGYFEGDELTIVDMSNVTQNATAFYGMAKYTNDAVGGLLFNGGVIAFFCYCFACF